MARKETHLSTMSMEELMTRLMASVSMGSQVINNITEGSIWATPKSDSYDDYHSQNPELTQKRRPLYILSINNDMATCLKVKTVHQFELEQGDQNTIMYNDGEAIRAIILNEPVTLPVSTFKRDDAHCVAVVVDNFRDVVRVAYTLVSNLVPRSGLPAYRDLIEGYLSEMPAVRLANNAPNKPMPIIRAKDLVVNAADNVLNELEEYELEPEDDDPIRKADERQRISQAVEDIQAKARELRTDKNIFDDREAEHIMREFYVEVIHKYNLSNIPNLFQKLDDALNSRGVMVTGKEILESTPEELSDKYNMPMAQAEEVVNNFAMLSNINKLCSTDAKIASSSDKFVKALHDGVKLDASEAGYGVVIMCKSTKFRQLFNKAKASGNKRYANVTFSSFMSWGRQSTAVVEQSKVKLGNSTYSMVIFPISANNLALRVI